MQDSSTACADTSLRRISPRLACVLSLLAIMLILPTHAFGGTGRYDKVVSRMKAVDKSPFGTDPADRQVGRWDARSTPSSSRDSKPADTRVLVISGQHGDEVSPVYAMLDLAEDLARDPALLRGTALVIVPVVNPDGFAADRRFNARGADLNRSWRSSSAPETRAVQRLVNRFKPQVVIDLHEWMDQDPVHTNCIEVAGFGAEPQLKLARLVTAFSRHEMARRGGNPNSIRAVFYRSEADNRLAHRHFSDMGICGLLVETASGQPRETRMRIYREFVTAAVRTLAQLPDQRVTTQLAAVTRNLGPASSPFPEEPKPRPAGSTGAGDIACWTVIVAATGYIVMRSLGARRGRAMCRCSVVRSAACR